MNIISVIYRHLFIIDNFPMITGRYENILDDSITFIIISSYLRTMFRLQFVNEYCLVITVNILLIELIDLQINLNLFLQAATVIS